jgi:CRISPR/Cas system-associated exonuclease Cas4 (RecB family)
MSKDIHRYSHSRLQTFKQCPRKHYYNYIEGIETPENEYTIPGKMFHECVERTIKGLDFKDVTDEFRKLCMTGKLPYEPDLLEYIVAKYFQYYAKEYSMEQNLLCEQEFKDQLDGEDFIIGYIDAVYETNGLVGIRDMKTTVNKLKYKYEDVLYNEQLLLYIPFAEDILKRKVSTKQIDEVRLAKLKPVPLLNNGKPSKSKELLDLVTYEDYYDALAERGLEKEAEYQSILQYLEERGHPLFNRITIQIVDDKLVETNAEEVLKTYTAAKLDTSTYRVKGPLCNYCAYKELCDLDRFAPSDASREIIIEKIQNNTK